MRVETVLLGPTSRQYSGVGQSSPGVASLVVESRELEALGFDSLSAPEAGHDPFLPLMVAAEHTRRVRLGTNVAIAFPRSPMVTAQLAWDLNHYSQGRFQLGLGTQVKAHNERRYATPWSGPPVPRLREYLQCLRAIFDSFQHPEKPTWFEGQTYRFSLLPRFFSPGPAAHPFIPLYCAAVNPPMAMLAGELCEGLRLHPIATFRYTREVLVPAIAAGAARTGRDVRTFDLVGAPFIALGRDDAELERAREALRQQIAFYASTPAYRPVLAHHGWAEIGRELHQLSRAARWADMSRLISDPMLEQWAIVARYEQLADTVRQRTAGLYNTIVLAELGAARQELDLIRDTVRRLQAA